jgi:hypothetical protein
MSRLIDVTAGLGGLTRRGLEDALAVRQFALGQVQIAAAAAGRTGRGRGGGLRPLAAAWGA